MKVFLPWRLCLLWFLCAACASKPSLPSGNGSKERTTSAETFFVADDGPSKPVNENTEIRPGFLLDISSPVDKSLNLKTRVSLQGDVKLPYDLRWVAAGTSVKNLSAKLNEHFRPLYKVAPQIRVEIAEKKYFIEVRGLVANPGPLLVKERESIEDIMQRSGDGKNQPGAGVVQIKRGENKFNIDLTEYFQGRGLDRSPKWYGGEKVLFLRASTALAQDESSTIQLIGDVRTPGPLAFKNNADFYHYLVKAGGTTPTSDLDRIEVVRHTAQGPFSTKGSAIEIAKHLTLEPGDTIILGSTLPGKSERRLQIITALASIISAISIFSVAF